MSITRYALPQIPGDREPPATGAPPLATASVHPRQILRIGIGIGRVANDSVGLDLRPPRGAALTNPASQSGLQLSRPIGG